MVVGSDNLGVVFALEMFDSNRYCEPANADQQSCRATAVSFASRVSLVQLAVNEFHGETSGIGSRREAAIDGWQGQLAKTLVHS